MTLSASIQAGNEVEFRAVFSAAASGLVGDPIEVAFSWEVGGGEETSYVFGVDDELVKDAVGTYFVRLPTLGLVGPGANVKLTGQWDTQGGITVSESITMVLTGPKIPSPLS